ncbi:MAG: tRNA pseudouridine(55) synthase TruB [Terriglobales bacterium]
MNGVLVIDKPQGLTSHDVVNRVRRMVGERSVGHLGTLDPMATGVLPMVLGNFTRLAQFYLGAAKSYDGEIRFGFATDTYDAEGEAVGPSSDDQSLTLECVREAAGHFAGTIQQMPPPFSAKKIAGVPAYKLARKKQEVALEPVTVEVHELEILSLEGDRARFRSRVSSGTYLRSIAHDIGQRLGMGAHLSALRRTAVAEFDLTGAVTLEAVAEAAEQQRVAELMVHPRRVVPQMPCVTAAEDIVFRIRNGQPVNLPEMSRAPLVKVFASQTELVAIAARIAGTLFQPKVVFPASA